LSVVVPLIVQHTRPLKIVRLTFLIELNGRLICQESTKILKLCLILQIARLKKQQLVIRCTGLNSIFTTKIQSRVVVKFSRLQQHRTFHCTRSVTVTSNFCKVPSFNSYTQEAQYKVSLKILTNRSSQFKETNLQLKRL
jgi:hypothetical protein